MVRRRRPRPVPTGAAGGFVVRGGLGSRAVTGYRGHLTKNLRSGAFLPTSGSSSRQVDIPGHAQVTTAHVVDTRRVGAVEKACSPGVAASHMPCRVCTRHERREPHMRRKAMAVAVAATTFFGLAACGGGGDSGGASVSTKIEGTGPITLVQGKDTSGFVQGVLDEWNAQHPDEKARLIELPQDADSQREKMIQNAQTKSDAYDVLVTDVVWTSEFAANRVHDPAPRGPVPAGQDAEARRRHDEVPRQVLRGARRPPTAACSTTAPTCSRAPGSPTRRRRGTSSSPTARRSRRPPRARA